MIAAPGMKPCVRGAPGIRPSVGRAHVSARSRAARIWFGALLVAICFEGLGRKFLTSVPSIAFYFAKDVVLLVGLLRFGITPLQLAISRRLLGGFRVVAVTAVAWTVVEMFNPAQPSLILAIIGLRAYWLWWLAPLVIGSALREAADRAAALQTLAVVALVVGAMAALQFASPANSAINTYARYEGEQLLEVATVAATGRARVSSTFSYLAGFTNFVVIVPPLLLALGLGERPRMARWLILVAAGVSLGVMPMSGSRGPLVFSGIALLLVVWRAGLLRAKRGLQVAAGVLAAAALLLGLAPEALEGVRARFAGEDTRSRFEETAGLLPPVALVANDFALLGEGTGTQQNARYQFRVQPQFVSEGEPGRLLAELGVPGYLLIWFTKLGLAVALARVAAALRLAGRRALSGGALAFSCFALIGNCAFDHIWQALFFAGVGLLVCEVEDVVRSRADRLAARGLQE